MKKKVLSLLLVAVMGISMLVGCGGGDDKQTGGDTQQGGNTEVTDVTLKVWAPENQQELLKKQAADFEALHPEWNISWDFGIVGEDNAKTEILKDVEAAADVFFYASDQVSELVKVGAIARLGGDTETMVKEGTPADVVDTVTVDGALYGIPFTHNTFFMFYDKTLLTEEDVKSLDAIVAKDTGETEDGKVIYNFLFDAAGGWKSGAWYYGAGLTVFGPKGNDKAAGCDWNSETGVAVTNYMIDFITNPKVAMGEDAFELIADHRLGAWFTGSWDYDKAYEVLGEDLGVTTIPTYNLNGTETQLLGFYGSKAIGVNAQSKNPAAAVAFAKYLGSEEQQIARFEASGQVPVNTNAAAIDAVKNDIVSSVLIDESLNCSYNQPSAAEFGSVYWNYAGTIADKIKTGELTKENSQQFMDELVKSMTAQ